MPTSLMDEDRPVAATHVEQVASNPTISQFAFTSAVTVTSSTEIMASLWVGQRPTAVFIMSPAMAKTFAESLLARVAEFQQLTGTAVKSAFEVAAESRARQ